MADPLLRFLVPEGGHRLDRLVADASGLGRRAVREWFRRGDVRIDGRRARPSDLPSARSEVVVLDRADAPPSDSAPGGAPGVLRTVVETPEFLVVAKPAGLHCERGRSEANLVDLLEETWGDLLRVGNRPAEGGLVHRIDQDTSGLVVVARHRAAYLRLREAFGHGRTRKQYLALAAGRLDRPVDVDLPLRRLATRVTPAVGRHDALSARTTLEPLERSDSWTLVLATMRTGVTHQVRAHLAALGHPLIGDETYGGPVLAGASRRGQLLHALRVQIADEVDASAGPPEDFLKDYARLKRNEE